MTGIFRWISTAGGPMVLVPTDALSTWEGDSNTPGRAGELTDYGRACEVDDFQGVIRCGRQQVAVIGAEPTETTWLPYGFFGGMIVQWNYAPSTEEAEESLLQLRSPRVLNELQWQLGKATLNIECSRMWLFDAALNFERLRTKDYIEIPVLPGRLELGLGFYKPSDEFSFVLHAIGSPLNVMNN